MVLIIVLSVFVLLIFVFGFFGGFYKVNIQVNNINGEILVYEDVIGAYNQTKKVIDKIYYKLLNKFKIETEKGFGIFYDNPKNVEQSKLRSEVGCIIESIDSEMLEQIKKHFKVKTLPNEKYLFAEFPFKGFLSIMIGMVKIYQKFGKYISENNYPDGPIMKIYDVPNKKIIYRKFISDNMEKVIK